MKIHLYIIITALQVLNIHGDCTVGRTNQEPMSPNPTPGLYIDRLHPASCSGQITQWNFCYFNPQNFHDRDRVQIHLQVWRFNSPQRGVQVADHVVTINIPEEPEEFQCETITLDQDSYMNITEGDYLGVQLLFNRVLPVVGNSQEQTNTVFRPFNSFLPTIVDVRAPGTIILSSNVLHVNAIVVMGGQDVTEPSTEGTPRSGITPTIDTSEIRLTPTTSISTKVKDEAGSSTGAIVGIVVSVLLLIIVMILVILVAIVIYARLRRKNVNEKSDTFTIDNAVYAQPIGMDFNTPSYTISQASSYEVPLNNSTTISTHLREATNGEHLYNTIGNDAKYETVLHQTTESVKIQKDSANGFNPYATLNTVDLDNYAAYLKQAAGTVYATPNSQSAEILFHEPPNDEEDIYRELAKRTQTIDSREIKIHMKIGEGAFSTVSKGSWNIAGVSYDVAIKSLIKSSSEIDKIKLLQEAAIMGQFQHPNIVKLFGVIKHGNSPMIVTEFLHRGDLLETLRSLIPDPGQLVEANTSHLLLSYSQQVSLGMHYLSSKGFVHRDLAARNIFVTKENICKVGDFGMSRELADTDYYVSHGGIVPVRWTAPEAIFYRKYSTASDVWSYGCLLYEIWTLGMRPYEGIATSKYLETLQVGYRLPPPPGCPRAIYSIMIRCWNPTTNKRPNFGDILTSLLKDNREILSIPAKDASTHTKATFLGASLEGGLEMYKDLQNTYLKKQLVAMKHHITVQDDEKTKDNDVRMSTNSQIRYESEDGNTLSDGNLQRTQSPIKDNYYNIDS